MFTASYLKFLCVPCLAGLATGGCDTLLKGPTFEKTEKGEGGCQQLCFCLECRSSACFRRSNSFKGSFPWIFFLMKSVEWLQGGGGGGSCSILGPCSAGSLMYKCNWWGWELVGLGVSVGNSPLLSLFRKPHNCLQ